MGALYLRRQRRFTHIVVMGALAATGVSIAPGVTGAQSLSQRMSQADGIVEVSYPSRPGACGDGRGMIGGVLGRSTYFSGNSSSTSNGSAELRRPCVHGPARAVATVVGGQVTRIRAFVGPTSDLPETRMITATATDAAAWLSEVVSHGTGRSASEAMLPLVLADGATPWPLLLGVTRDDSRPRDVRRAAMDWLSQRVSDQLGLSEAEHPSDDDEMRTQAVFVLSQRPKSESVPELPELARSARYPAVRKSAIFWLGQTGDPRAVQLYAELLGLR
jgi:hypothetical protein